MEIKTSIAVDLVQKSELSNKAWFIKLMQDNVSNEEFHKFCKEIMFLREYYDTTVGLYATDSYKLFDLNADMMFQLSEINFDAEVNFKKIT